VGPIFLMGTFPGGEVAGAWTCHSPVSSAKFENRVRLYLWSVYVVMQCTGTALPLTFYWWSTRVYKGVLGGKGLPGRLFEISGRKADPKEMVRMWIVFMCLWQEANIIALDGRLLTRDSERNCKWLKFTLIGAVHLYRK